MKPLGSHHSPSPRVPFGRAVLFAAVAGLAAVAGSLLASPWPGPAVFRAVLWPATAVAALVCLGPSPARALFACLGALPLAGVLLWLEPAAVGGPAGAALILGVGRLLAVRRSGLRDLGLEMVFGIVGIAFARLAGGPGALGLGLAVWAFHLAQAPRSLLAAGEAARSARGDDDPFDRAERRAREALGGWALRPREPTQEVSRE